MSRVRRGPFSVRRVDPERYLQLGRLAVAHAMAECFAFWRRADSECAGRTGVGGQGFSARCRLGFIDVDGEPKVARTSCVDSGRQSCDALDAGLSGCGIDIHNDTAEPWLVSWCLPPPTPHRDIEPVGPIFAVAVAGIHRRPLFDSEVSGVFRDLSNSFRFGSPTADGIQAVVSVAGRPHPLRDAFIVNPRPGQVNSGLRA